jgi:PTS system N-acetylglucosamine-specific IIC component
MKHLLESLQPMGRALMLPIAVLPIAALLLRLGQPDLLGVAAMAAAGGAIFSNLGLLFAIGIAVGLARENHGAAGLASVVGFLVTTKGAEVLIGVPAAATANFSGAAVQLAEAAFRARELAKLSVPAGLLNGLIAGYLYNRYSNIRLPDYLAFFSGRRFVPIACGCAGLLLALILGFGWPVLERGMDAMSQAVLSAGSLGAFLYGVLNRVLIITGLHHIINNVAWFLIGDYNGVTGDLQRFFAGDPQAGSFMSGFFPVMMFGLPAACLAMYHTALPARRKAVGGLLFSMGLTSFLTGVTEPIEFSFMFLAPALFGLHALLTGISMAVMGWLNVHLGFGFSAGMFDYVLNYSLATRPLLLLPVGVLYFALYYGVFRYCIVRFGLKTLGREDEPVNTAAVVPEHATPAEGWVRALGGRANLLSVDACATRLRLTVADDAPVSDGQLKKLGALGVIRPGKGAVQVVVGLHADQLAGEIRAALAASAPLGVAPSGAHTQEYITSAAAPDSATATAAEKAVADSIAAALGGAANIAQLRLLSSRVHVELRDKQTLQMKALERLRLRGFGITPAGALHLLIGPAAAGVHAQLELARANASPRL